MKNKPSALTKTLISVGLGLTFGAILILIVGANPLKGYAFLLQGSFRSIERIGNTLATATPLILTGLSVAFAFKTGLFNIGAAGQMLMGGLAATAIALKLPALIVLPKPILLIVVCLGAILGGMAWGGISGYLKAKFNVHEVVSTIMLNWTAYWVVYYIVPMYLKGEYLETESATIPTIGSLKVGWLTDLFQGSYINLGIFIAILIVLLIKFVLDRTTLGYELKAVGYNRHAAFASGIKVNRNIALSMAIAGGLAGLAGATFYTGYASNIQIGVLPSQGFDGIAVALLGSSHPWGVVGSAVFFGILQSGKGFMNAMIDIPPEISDVIIAIIIYFTATILFVERLLKRYKARKGGEK